jgi:hypothetical protein
MEETLKLLYCAHCGDIVRLFSEKRTCLCGKSWGYYLDDRATTVQTYPGLSLAISNYDFDVAVKTFSADPHHFSPILSLRSWINPLSEPDVKFVRGEEIAGDESEQTDENEIVSKDGDPDNLSIDN